MTKKEFIAGAIANGHGTDLCGGWDWMEENLGALDYIFHTPEYRKQKGMKYLCMPFLIKAETAAEIEVLETAWYLNNKREHALQKKEYAEKMTADGWMPLSQELIQRAFDEGKKIVLSGTMSQDCLTGHIEVTLKPVKQRNGSFFLLPPKAKRRGYSPSQFDNAFIKLM